MARRFVQFPLPVGDHVVVVGRLSESEFGVFDPLLDLLWGVHPFLHQTLFQDLWKSYFKAMTIKERLNPTLQRRCMPRRYWAYLTEKQE